MKKIRKAIIPIAGFGTRFLPITKSQPKEMLPIIDKPVIQYIVEEIIAAGIKEIIFVTSRNKRSIEDYFDHYPELEDILRKKKKKTFLEEVKRTSNMADFSYLRQPTPRGDGDAIYRAAKRFLSPDESAIVLFGDDIVKGPSPVKDLLATYNKYHAPVIALNEVPLDDISLYGIAEGDNISKRRIKIKRFIEKPSKNQTKSRLAAIGKYIITPQIIKELKKLSEDKDIKGEVILADAFNAYLMKNKSIYGQMVKGERFDCGNKFGLLKASIEYGLEHPEVKNELKKYLSTKKIKK